uniref:Amidase domain-containing protein n=1 Tax=Oncorhynchus tshawytscha TaxID=74940 RepID=A0A8C8HRS8_ONCTS
MERSHISLESLLSKVDSFNKGVMDRMDNYKQLIFGTKPKWTVILTVTACGASALVLLLKWFGHQQSWKKIQKAKVRREKSLQRAEHAVCQFNESHPETDTSLILSLSLAELSKQLKDGTLTPQAVFHSYMEKTLEVNRRLNCCTEVLLESWDQLEDVDSHKDGLLYGVPVSIKENIGYKVYQSSKPLRIGYYENDGYAMPSPSMGRALRETKALLEKAGHTLVSFSPPRLIYAMHELVVRGLLGDGCTTLLSHLKGGPVD